MENISGYGLKIVITASTTFPAGMPVTQFADDTDPLDIPAITVAETGMGLNGDLAVWSRATPIDITIGVLPNGDDDRNLALLLESDRVAKGKRGARNVITLTAMYPDGRVKVLSNGAIISGSPMNSVASAGRYKSRTYSFRFEGMNGT
jgi:hypothetical protein